MPIGVDRPPNKGFQPTRALWALLDVLGILRVKTDLSMSESGAGG